MANLCFRAVSDERALHIRYIVWLSVYLGSAILSAKCQCEGLHLRSLSVNCTYIYIRMLIPESYVFELRIQTKSEVCDPRS